MSSVRYRVRLGRGTGSVGPEGPDRPCARAARLLALAHAVERALASGTVAFYGDAARALGMSQSHLAHVTKLTSLSPAIQSALLDGTLDVTEARLREVTREALWERQDHVVARLAARQPVPRPIPKAVRRYYEQAHRRCAGTPET